MLRRWRAAHWTTKLTIAFGGAVSAYVVTAAITQVYIRSSLLPEMQESSANLDRFEAKILADLRLLDEKPVFTDTPRENNAERFLSGFIAWTGQSTGALDSPEHQRLVEFIRTHESATTIDDEWTKLLADPTLSSLDLSWVDQLTAYDHIDFATNTAHAWILSNFEKLNGVDRAAASATLPIPEMNELRLATLARVAQLSKERRPMDALSLHRHVASLLASTDTLIGSMSAVSMLKTEKNLAKRLNVDSNADSNVKVPAPVDDARIDAYRRVSWAWLGIQQLRAGTQVGAYDSYLKRNTSACTAAYETLNFASQLQDYFEPTVPLEFDLSDRLVKAQEFQLRLLELCEHENLKVFLAPIPASANPFIVHRHFINVARIPFLRRIVGLKMANDSAPNYFRLYDESNRQPASK